jgi:hypothetical protein
LKRSARSRAEAPLGGRLLATSSSSVRLGIERWPRRGRGRSFPRPCYRLLTAFEEVDAATDPVVAQFAGESASQ